MSLADIVQRGWNAVGAGDFDTLSGMGDDHADRYGHRC
jgi:hypothetical protein